MASLRLLSAVSTSVFPGHARGDVGRGRWESRAGQTVVVGSAAAGSGDPTGTEEL